MNLEDFLTVEQVCKKLGCGRRSLYRAMHRAAEAGEKDFTVEVLGRRLFPKTAVALIEKYYYPYYSEQHQAMVKEWGRMGGSTKAANQRRNASGSRGPSSASGRRRGRSGGSTTRRAPRPLSG